MNLDFHNLSDDDRVQFRNRLQNDMSNEMALKNRVRHLYEQKDSLKGYGFGTKKGAKHNPWLDFLKYYRLKHKNLHDQATLMRNASIAYHNISGMGYGTKTGARHNPWVKYLKHYDVEHRGKHQHGNFMHKAAQIYDDHEDVNIDFGSGFGTKAGAAKNKWIAFLKQHKDSGHTLVQLRKLYADSKKKKAATKKKVVKRSASRKKKVVKKRTTKKRTTRKRKPVGGVLFDY